MPITIDDLPELLRLLREHPEWRDALRVTLLSEELLQLPALVERRFAELASILAELAQRQAETEQRLAELAQRQAETEQRLAELTQRQAETEQRLAELAQRVEQLTVQVSQLTQQMILLTQRVDSLAADVAELKQFHLEASYRERAPAIFGSPQFRRVRVLSRVDIDDLLASAVDAGQMSWDEFKSVMEADLIVRGRTPHIDQLYLVVEISWGIGSTDVERAIERAAVLRRAGFHARPAVAGRRLTPDAEQYLERVPFEQRPIIAYDGVIEWGDGS